MSAEYWLLISPSPTLLSFDLMHFIAGTSQMIRFYM